MRLTRRAEQRWLRRIFRTLWPRYCACCKHRFIYSSACSDHNPLAKGYGWDSGYETIYGSIRRWAQR